MVISDFFDPAGLPAVTEALRGLRHKLLLVQLTRASDRDPAVGGGDLRLLDCETEEVQDVSVTPAVLERYRAAYDRFTEGLASFASGRDAGLVTVDADLPVAPQLATLFEGGRLSV